MSRDQSKGCRSCCGAGFLARKFADIGGGGTPVRLNRRAGLERAQGNPQEEAMPSLISTFFVEQMRRLDESKPGSGLGLSIGTETAGMYAGSVVLGDADIGGLRVQLRLPAVA